MPHSQLLRERLRFLEIDQDVVENLRAAGQLLEPELDDMLDRFYSHILDEPLLQLVFTGKESIQRAREGQKKHWLETVFQGRLTSSYFDRARAIGRAHARVGLTPDLYIGGYSKMLDQFIAHIARVSTAKDRDPTPMIQALCKAVLLDLDLVIFCYLEAKDQQMVSMLERATTFSEDITRLNADLASAAAQLSESVETFTNDTDAADQSSVRLAQLGDRVDAVTEKAKEIGERTSQLPTRDRLHIHKASDQPGTIARLKSVILGD